MAGVWKESSMSPGKEKLNRVRCPHCGYEMPIVLMPGAYCKGLWVKCKGRRCGKEFEIRIEAK